MESEWWIGQTGASLSEQPSGPVRSRVGQGLTSAQTPGRSPTPRSPASAHSIPIRAHPPFPRVPSAMFGPGLAKRTFAAKNTKTYKYLRYNTLNRDVPTAQIPNLYRDYRLARACRQYAHVSREELEKLGPSKKAPMNNGASTS